MLDTAVEQLLRVNHKSYMIDGDRVANVTDTNPLDHALLVLTKAGYSRVPVLDKTDHFKGLITLSAITEVLTRTAHGRIEDLSAYTVAEVMMTDVRTVPDTDDLERLMNYLVDDAFVPVVNSAGLFRGIVTRRELLKQINFMSHNLEKQFKVTPQLPLGR